MKQEYYQKSEKNLIQVTDYIYADISSEILSNINQIRKNQIPTIISLCPNTPLCLLALASEKIQIISIPLISFKNHENLTNLCILSALTTIFTTLEYQPKILIISDKWATIGIICALYKFLEQNTSVIKELEKISQKNPEYFNFNFLKQNIKSISEKFINFTQDFLDSIQDLGDILFEESIRNYSNTEDENPEHIDSEYTNKTNNNTENNKNKKETNNITSIVPKQQQNNLDGDYYKYNDI